MFGPPAEAPKTRGGIPSNDAPSSRPSCDTYFDKQPLKICKMRSDILSQLLALANVGAYQRSGGRSP